MVIKQHRNEKGQLTTGKLTASERFWPKVNKDGPLWNGTPCWLWGGSPNTSGYGTIRVNGVNTLAHRYSYELHIGLIPNGYELDHLCRRLMCVSPAHLEAVTHRENCLRGISNSAVNAMKTHCLRGHEFNEENTYRNSQGRKCRACERVRWHERALARAVDAMEGEA